MTKADTSSGEPFAQNNRFNPVFEKLEQGSVLEDWVPRDAPGINMMFRRMHVRDVVAGPAIDIYASMPWSEFDIGGIKDPALRRFYEEALSMFTPEVLTTIAKEFLVIGRFCASLVFNAQKGYFDQFEPHDPDFLEIMPVPYRGFNPLIDLRISPSMRMFMNSQDPRVQRIRALMPPQFLEKFRQQTGKVPLDQFSTLFLARKISPYDSVGTSMLCVTGDTLVSTKNDGLIRIDELWHETDEPGEHEKEIVVATTKGKTATTSHWVYSGEQPTINIQTKHGYSVTGTPKHPLLVLNPVTLDTEWKHLNDIQAGDLVAIDYKSDLWPSEPIDLSDVHDRLPTDDQRHVRSRNNGGSRCVKYALPKTMTTDLGLVLGYLVSEGLIGERRIEFSNTDAEVLADFKRAFMSVFPDAVLSERTGADGIGLLICYSVHIRSFIEDIIGGRLGAREKVVPDVVLHGTSDCAKAFLSAAFEGDGTSCDHQAIYYTSSATLASQVQQLLLKFGIVSDKRLHVTPQREHRGRTIIESSGYRVAVASSFTPAFHDAIGFRSKKKQKTLDDRHRAITSVNVNAFVAALVDDRIVHGQGKGYYSTDDGALTRVTIPTVVYRESTSNLNVEVRNVVREISNSAYKKLRSVEDYFWDKVESKEDAGVQRVYDICVPETHAFVGNGIVMHNTRIVGLWALEKALMDATVTAARRRAGTILHVTAGIDEVWEPADAELDMIGNLFIQADEDPVGAVVTTRTGVQAQEIRQGGQIWKISDEWAFLSEAKMRALGISDAILDGSACMVGTTLIPTAENGIVRIGEISNKGTGQWHDVRLTVGSRYTNAQTKKWLNNGVRPTMRVVTETGNDIECTYNHPVLVLNGRKTEWRRTDELKVGDLLCASTTPVVRMSKLELSLGDPKNVVHGGQRKELNKPMEMTPALAFLLGAIVSEGSISKKASQVRFANTDLKFIAAYKKHMRDVFGVDGTERVASTPDDGHVGHYNGVEIRSTKTCYEVITCSKTLVEWLEQLGCYADGQQDGLTASHHKHVPWSVLQSDRDSQLAYLAAYIEGDGSISESRLTLHSASRDLLLELQVMLGAHGFTSRVYDDRVEIGSSDRSRLAVMVAPYMVSKTIDIGTHMARRTLGIPNSPWADLIRQRKIGHNRHGIRFVNDEGVEVELRGFRNPCDYDKNFLYDKLDRGDYTVFLEQLKAISTSAYQDLMALFGARYRFTSVESIEQAGEQNVYDLSMEDGTEPAFVANGLVVHNTYSNMETARSLMVEQILVFRQQMTQALFGWITEQLARAHGFINDPKRAAYNGQIRVPTVQKDMEMQSALAMPARRRALISPYGSEAAKYIEAAEEQMRLRINRSQQLSMEKALKTPRDHLIIPTIQWRKEMKPTQDEAYIALLEKMEEKGLPVPKRIWAAAGGYDLDAAIEMMHEDSKITKKIAEVTQEPAEDGGDDSDLAPTGEPKTPPGEGLKKLDDLLGPGGDKEGGEERDSGPGPSPGGPGPGGGGEVSPEKPPTSGPPPANPVKNPAPPSEVKPQRNPMASLVSKLPFFTDEKFAGLRRGVALSLAETVDRNINDVVSNPQAIHEIVRAQVQKADQRPIALYLCARAGFPVGYIEEKHVEQIAKALCTAGMKPKTLMRELHNLALITRTEASANVRASVNSAASSLSSKVLADSTDNLPANSKFLIGGVG
jgi:intein/homing endonuclease